jgi:hypothetical protein
VSRRGLLLSLVLMVACREAPPPRDVVAESRSGSVRLREVERALNSAPRPGPAAGPKAPELAEQVGRYRRAAEALVVERALLRDLENPGRAVRGLGKEYERLRREVVIDLFEGEAEATQPIRVSEAEVEKYFEAHREEFHRPPQRLVWHLFRRHQDPAHPAATIAFLEDLRERARKGEPFPLLARQYSQSETRLLDGRLGLVGRGRLPRPLEDVVFSLPERGVSKPVPVKGGALLFEVSEVVEEKRFPIEDVRALIALQLRDRERRERIARALGDRKAPGGSVVLDPETLTRLVQGADDEETVLSVGATKWTVKDFREALARLPP